MQKPYFLVLKNGFGLLAGKYDNIRRVSYTNKDITYKLLSQFLNKSVVMLYLSWNKYWYCCWVKKRGTDVTPGFIEGIMVAKK